MVTFHEEIIGEDKVDMSLFENSITLNWSINFTWIIVAWMILIDIYSNADLTVLHYLLIFQQK